MSIFHTLSLTLQLVNLASTCLIFLLSKIRRRRWAVFECFFFFFFFKFYLHLDQLRSRHAKESGAECGYISDINSWCKG